MSPRIDFQQLQFEAQHRWLRPAEICEILQHYQMFQITSEPPNKPPSGSLFLFDRKVLRYFRKDGHNWRKKKGGNTVKEAHEKLKMGSVDVLHCYYAHGEENTSFQRRSYWMLEPDLMHIVFVHYLDVKVNKTNIGRNTDSVEVTSDSQKGTTASSGFHTNYSRVPSRSIDSMSPTSTLTSLCEDADSEDIHQASSVLHSSRKSQNMGNGHPTDKIGAHSNRINLMHPFSGDHQQSSISGKDYNPFVRGDKARVSGAHTKGQKSHGMASWDNVCDHSAGLHADPSLNIPFEDNTRGLLKWTITQSSSSKFPSDYSTSLLVDETDNSSSGFASDLITSNGEQKENFSKQHTTVQSQHAPKSNSECEVSGEEGINYALTVKRALLDGEESLKKVDSFTRWITKDLAEVDDLYMQSSPGISWSTDECGHVIDDTSLNLSLSQDQLFSISDFSPKWAYADSEIEVLIIGIFVKSQPEVATCKWSCMFGEVEVSAEVLGDGILSCQAPPHKIGRVPFYVTCSNRFACSELREFEYRDGLTRNVDFADFFNSLTEMMLHLRLGELLSSNSVQPSSKAFEAALEKRKLIFELISLKEKEEYSIKEELAVEMDLSQHKSKEHVFHRQVKEKLYSWLLQKVTESGKGPNALDKDGQGVLHLVAALGYDWAITPILTAGVHINFRDVNGWTALHWAASCGRERTVAVLVSMGAAAGAVTDPCPTFPSGRTPADLASCNGHKGISGFLAESLLTSHLDSLTMDDPSNVDGKDNISGRKVVQTVSERSATPVLCGDIPDALCLKDSLTAVRNATLAADCIHQVFRMQSFRRKQAAQYVDDEFGLSDQQALSLLASKASKYGLGEGLSQAAAIHIQKKFRGWTKRKEFLIIRQRIVKIQAHIRGHQVRKKYKPIIWSVGILEKVILRWRRKGNGLRGFRPDALNKVPNQPSDSSQEDDYDFLKEGRKQSEVRFQKALSRVKSMVQYPEARAQYRRVLNVVEDFSQTKACNMDLVKSEETIDRVEDLIDIGMFFDDDNFIPIAFD